MKIKLNPFLQAVRGKMGNTVFRLCHTGEWQIARRPDMQKVKWSQAQKEHRIRFAMASHYAKYCMQIPELRAYYLEMAHKRGKKRPFDEAVRDHFQGNDKLGEWAQQKRLKGEVPALPSATRSPATVEQPKSVSPQSKNVAINEQNRPQTDGPVLPVAPQRRPLPVGGPATMNDRWIFASLVISNTMYGESDFYSVSTMCILAGGNAVGLPAEERV